MMILLAVVVVFAVVVVVLGIGFALLFRRGSTPDDY